MLEQVFSHLLLRRRRLLLSKNPRKRFAWKLWTNFWKIIFTHFLLKISKIEFAAARTMVAVRWKISIQSFLQSGKICENVVTVWGPNCATLGIQSQSLRWQQLFFFWFSNPCQERQQKGQKMQLSSSSSFVLRIIEQLYFLFWLTFRQ